MRRHTIVTTEIGQLLVVASEDAITGVVFADAQNPPNIKMGPLVMPTSPLLMEAAAQLNAFVDGNLREFDLPVQIPDEGFSAQVLQRICQVPYGKTTTYGVIAADLGRPTAARAVGHATGSNPLCLLVPCHRVLGAGGKMTGYAGGIERKRRLLQMEASAALEDSVLVAPN